MRTWTTPDGLTFEGEQTGDGRLFVAGSLYWEDGPWPLRVDEEDDGMHAGAVLVGSIEAMERSGGAITGNGTLDDEDDGPGAAAARRLDQGDPLGVSVDMDDMAAEWVMVDDGEDEDGVVILAASFPTATVTFYGNRTRIAAPGIGALVAAAGITMTAAAGDGDPMEEEEDAIVLFEDSMDSIIIRVTRARIRGATLVDIPAFHRAAIVLDAAEGETAAEGEEGEPVAAAGCRPCIASLRAAAAQSGHPDAPAALFADPRLTALTPLRYTEERGHLRVTGHIAGWETCHTGAEGTCLRAPRSASAYRWFHVGSYLTAEADLIAVGALTLGGGHADRLLSYRAAMEHYDRTSARVADVRAGEDAHGVWISGVVRPGVAANRDRMRELRAATPSGDWRWIDGHLELGIAHAVNMPGFPVPQIGLAASGTIYSLVAAGAREVARSAAPPDMDSVIEDAVGRALTAFVAAEDARRAAPARRRLDVIRRERALARLRG